MEASGAALVQRRRPTARYSRLRNVRPLRRLFRRDRVIHITRKYRFSASHRLHAPGLSEEQNFETYGKCNNPYGHGHNYEIEVSARGPVEPRSGHAVDRAALDRLVEDQVLGPFDHRNLNAESL